MEDPLGDEKHVIGIPELYQEMRSLGDKLTDYINRQDVASNTAAHQIDELRRDLDDLQVRFESEQVRRANTTRQAWMATLTSLVFPVVVAVVVAILMSKNGG